MTGMAFNCDKGCASLIWQGHFIRRHQMKDEAGKPAWMPADFSIGSVVSIYDRGAFALMLKEAALLVMTDGMLAPCTHLVYRSICGVFAIMLHGNLSLYGLAVGKTLTPLSDVAVQSSTLWMLMHSHASSCWPSSACRRPQP